jgi:drug/metabolite transporter (DMT)-like permease
MTTSEDQLARANMRGIVCMLVSMAFYIVCDALTKSAGETLPVGQVIAIRSAVASVLLAPFVPWSGLLLWLPQLWSRAMTVRNVGDVGVTILFCITLVHVPIANATAIMQTSPLAITAAAAIFLKERVGWRRWTATMVGFLGALLIIRPGNADFTWWYLPAIISLLFVVMRDLGTRFVDKSVPTLVVTLFTFLLTIIGTLVLMAPWEGWRLPNQMELAKSCGAGFFVTFGALFLVMALRSGGEISTVVAFRYSIVLWSITIGWLVWGQIPHPMSLVGIVVVVGAGLYTVHRERVRRLEAQRANG